MKLNFAHCDDGLFKSFETSEIMIVERLFLLFKLLPYFCYKRPMIKPNFTLHDDGLLNSCEMSEIS